MYVYPYGDSQQLNLDWIINKIKELENQSASAADLEEIANVFIALTHSSGTQYRKYDYCFYQDKLYRALNDNIGPFNTSDWTEVRLGDDLSILTRLINTAAIMDVKFDTSGTDGKLQQKYEASYHDIVAVDYTPVQNSKRPLSSNAGYELNVAINNIDSALAIVANGNTHGVILQYQYVYVKNHNTLSEGLYKAITDIAANATLTTSNLSTVSSGGFNDLYIASGTATTNTAVCTGTCKWIKIGRILFISIEDLAITASVSDNTTALFTDLPSASTTKVFLVQQYNTGASKRLRFGSQKITAWYDPLSVTSNQYYGLTVVV